MANIYKIIKTIEDNGGAVQDWAPLKSFQEKRLIVHNSKLYRIKENYNSSNSIINDIANDKLELLKVGSEERIIELSETIIANEDYILPLEYEVGSYDLNIFIEGFLFNRGQHYLEIGNPGEISSKIRFLSNIKSGYSLVVKIN